MTVREALNHIGFDLDSVPPHITVTSRRPRKVPMACVPAIPNADNIVIIETLATFGNASPAFFNDWVEIDMTQTDPKQLASYRNRVQHLINRTAAKYDREKRLAEGATVTLPPAPHHPHRRNRHKSTSKHE